jgi:hypothetical protein
MSSTLAGLVATPPTGDKAMTPTCWPRTLFRHAEAGLIVGVVLPRQPDGEAAGQLAMVHEFGPQI